MSFSEKNKAMTELLYQLADDDFIHAHRGSEWLGLAPHIEEDVAFSSINQDTMGHAAMYYKLLEDLGEGKADDLSHRRKPEQYRNAIILEERNGSGEYLESPQYDWAFTVIRHFFYDVSKKIRLESLKQSSYEPLSEAARKILTEQYYHLMHWEVWFKQLMTSTAKARKKMEAAIFKVWDDFGGVLTLGPYGDEMVKAGLIEDEEVLKTRFTERMQKYFQSVDFKLVTEPQMKRGDGRAGVHTPDLEHALSTLSEVYVSDAEAAGW
ncbi:ring-1,2-phenylacetyl-CoA epoxidase subunit PaaC [Scopulibacillus daqui]|uniref:Ring-1,2-phenylacetyl-CoA epoxidase subunit PaaC n=1 Tax=Scopulibacillus daqui TaxID=1469162 RepID=A0ABS2PWB2_9BACL|nr:1,2-phenylacetyl-CoA epoxidase subunit PaaC [Scopulibacillus daqui]MBM7643845.1 ring-1,2-phenylacetyl-CoA epoxidase subunit PaaC [Scopulibacillus daqui]